MSMQSASLLPVLRELPGAAYGRRKSLREILADLAYTDRAMFAAEFASATSFGLWAIFDGVNVDDGLRETMNQAHERAFGNYDGNLVEHWQEVVAAGDASVRGFINALKGKAAEINAADLLEQKGYTGVAIAANPTQPVWDISAIAPDGESALFQVKTGAEGYANSVMDAMDNTPDVHFLVSSEIYDRIAGNAPELLDRVADIGPDYALVTGTQDGLHILSSNLGIDIPDGVGDIMPYAGAIIAGARLIHSVLRTEKEFKAVDRTTRNKIQVVQTLTLMSRMGITTVLSTVGGMGGAAAGSAVPFVGNLIGGIVGTVAGAGMGMYLNQHLQPHMLNLALDITGLTGDDLFYYKNKPRIDQTALRFRNTAAGLAALPDG